MPPKRGFRRSHTNLSARKKPRGGRARNTAVVMIVAIGALGAGAAPGFAASGSVYYDGNGNAGAGFDYLNGSMAGFRNVALGHSVMRSLTTGNDNVATGFGPLDSNTIGHDNLAIGTNALGDNTNGYDNFASGTNALAGNTAGSHNIATGTDALFLNPTGNDNIATGFWALKNATGNSNIGLGSGAGANLTFGNNNIDIANAGVAGESAAIRIGTAGNQNRTFIQGIWSKTISGTTKSVVVNSAGRLGTAPVPAAPALKGESRTLNRLRAEVRRQGAEIQRLREQVRRSG